MRHASRLRGWGFRAVLGGAGGVLAALMGCERDIYRVPPPPRTSEASVRLDEDKELGAACPSPVSACGARLTPSCLVSCQPTADGCANVWELHRLVLPPELTGEWLGFDPEGNHGLFVQYPIPDSSCGFPGMCDEPKAPPPPTEYLSWSAADGVRSLGMDVRQVSDDAGVVLGSIEAESLYWTPAAGVQPVPLTSATMARNGRLFAGLTNGQGTRWAPETGRTEVFQLEPGASAVHAEGDVAMFVAPRAIVYTSAGGERTDITLPSDASPDARFGRVVLAANGTSFAVELEHEDGSDLYRWADGVFERIELPEHPSGTWFIDRVMVSGDGRVVVVELEDGEDRRQVRRWSAETGVQLLSEEPLYTQHVSFTGDVIVGRTEPDEGRPRVLRWTLDEALQESPATQAAGRVAFDGDVLVDMDDDGILAFRYGQAVGVPLPLDHLRGRMLAQSPFWMTLQQVSSNTRMLGGIGYDGPGNTLLWVARLQTVCSGAP